MTGRAKHGTISPTVERMVLAGKSNADIRAALPDVQPETMNGLLSRFRRKHGLLVGRRRSIRSSEARPA